MKKKYLVLVAFLFILSSSGISPRLIAQDESVLPPDQVLCNCTFFGNCRASGNGSLCAQSEPGGNIDCSSYDNNCGFGG